GCEACHGPARDWLVEHRDASWRRQDARTKEKAGMNALAGLADRALVCAGCHIGAPADPARGLPLRDMTHEFIAPGHPRLMFEFGAYLANDRRHWGEKDTRWDSEARAWQVGQAVSLESALHLLGDRAGRPDWPELAEYDCHACHHPVRAESWRRHAYSRVAGGGSLGAS